MSSFWFLAAAMTALALLFVVPPLLSRKPVRQVAHDHDRITVAVIKQQLAELDADLQSGKLEQAAYAAARHDLERALLDDIGPTTASSRPASGHSGRWASAVLALVIPAVALWLYQQLGSKAALEIDRQVAEIAADKTGHSLQRMIEQLAKKMQANPENIQGWVMLASSYSSIGQYDKAADAYKEALQRAGNHPRLLTDYADTLAMASGGTFTDEVGKLLETALQLQADNVKALWLLGHWHYQRDQFEAALKQWQRAAQLLPADSKDSEILNQQITLVRSKLGLPATTAMPVVEKSADDASGAAIEVTVSLDPSLQDKASPEDTLFIFARAARGPRMPLAIVRKQVKDLPLTVTLDDSQAMSPQMTLSKFPEVSIGARISKSGNAIPASGDLTGNASPVSTREQQPVKIVISESVP